MNNDSPGLRFREALEANKPLQVVGTINAYCAIDQAQGRAQAKCVGPS